jgi:hypothetical protein
MRWQFRLVSRRVGFGREILASCFVENGHSFPSKGPFDGTSSNMGLACNLGPCCGIGGQEDRLTSLTFPAASTSRARTRMGRAPRAGPARPATSPPQRATCRCSLCRRRPSGSHRLPRHHSCRHSPSQGLDRHAVLTSCATTGGALFRQTSLCKWARVPGPRSGLSMACRLPDHTPPR